MKISLIAVIGRNRELGLNNRLLWHIPEDLKRFKKITENHAVIMGRKTYESIGRPLPNRLNIVITRDYSFNIKRHSGKPKPSDSEGEAHPESIQGNNQTGFWTSQNDNVVIANSLEEALKLFKEDKSLRETNSKRNNPAETGTTLTGSPRPAKAGLAMTVNTDEIFIIGGGQIYHQAIKIADKLYLTIVDAEAQADTYFPDYSDFKKVVKEEYGNSAGLKYRFVELER